MAEKKGAILNIGKALMNVSFTTLAAMGSASGNIWLAGLSALPGAVLAGSENVGAQLSKITSQHDELLELPVPEWWDTDQRVWEGLCMEIGNVLPALLEDTARRLRDVQGVVTMRVVQQAFIDSLAGIYLTWAPTPEERRKIGEAIAAPTLEKLDQVLKPLIEQMRQETFLIDTHTTTANTTQMVTLLEKIHEELPKQSVVNDERTKKELVRQSVPNNIPELPPHYLPRSSDLERIIVTVQANINKTMQATAITSYQRTAALQGMGGIGKSVIAVAFARHEETRRTFTDGIVWLTIGQQPEMLERLQQTGRAFNDNMQGYLDLANAQDRLHDLLKDRACLIVLDDVWSVEHARPFLNSLGQKCHLLITTREGQLVTNLGAEEIRLDVLSDEGALTLLADWVGKDVSSLPHYARAVARECGNLPFALALCGAMIRDGTPWEDLLRALKEAKLEFIEREDLFPNYPYKNVLKAIQVSIQYLKAEVAKHYYELAVFPEDLAVPEAAVLTFWLHTNGFKDYEARKMITLLERKALLRLEGKTSGRQVTLHDLQHDYLQAVVKDKTRLHEELLEAYRAKCSDGWHTGPKDGYFFNKLAYHLSQAQQEADLRKLLTDFHWLQAKLDATDVTALVEDYDLLAKDGELQLVKDAILLSAYVLAADKTQLAAQLLGHLLSYETSDMPNIQTLLLGAKQYSSTSWLRPLMPTLNQAGSTLLRAFSGHEASVKAVAVTSNGKWVVSASEDKTLKVWDWKTGESKHTLRGHTDAVWAVVVTSDGKWAISASQDTKLKVWDLKLGIELLTFSGHQNWVHAVVVTPDGEQVVSGSEAGDLKVWKLGNGLLVRTLPGHANYINGLAVTPDGKRAVSASRDSTLKVWDLESGKLLHTLQGHEESVLAVAVTPDGKRAVSASRDSTLKVWDLESGKLLHTLQGHTGSIRAVAVTPDGERVVSGSRDSTLKVWDLESGGLLRSLITDSGPITAVAVLDNGRKVISASENQTVKVWDLERDTRRSTLSNQKHSILALAVTANGRVISASQDKTLTVWDLHDGKELQTLHSLHENKWAYALAVTAVGWMISTSWDKTLKIWDLESRKELFTLFGHKSAVKAVTITKDGRVVSGSRDATLKVWDLESRKELYTLSGHTASVEAVAVTTDGRHVISASCDKTLKVWDLESRKELYTLSGHTASVEAVAVTTDGRHVISASCDKTLKVWNLESGKMLHTLIGHVSWVHDVAVTSDGRYAVSASDDNTFKLWTINDGHCIATFTGEDALSTCVIAPDEITVVVGEKWGRIHFLRLENI